MARKLQNFVVYYPSGNKVRITGFLDGPITKEEKVIGVGVTVAGKIQKHGGNILNIGDLFFADPRAVFVEVSTGTCFYNPRGFFSVMIDWAAEWLQENPSWPMSLIAANN